MPLPQNKKITYKEFLKIDKESKEYLEFIDGEIYLQASPSTSHQRISSRLGTMFGNYFQNRECEHFVAPYDVILKNEKETHTHKVQPDLLVICDKKGITENNYVGTPTLVIEILSPGTKLRDCNKKFHLYQRFGVKEYWIISPKDKTIDLLVLENGIYNEPILYEEDAICKSNVFKDLEIPLKEIFD